MFNLRFFVPVLALAAMALPAGANIVAYCDGGGCGSNTINAFNTALATDNASWASTTNILFGTGSGQGVLSGNEYTDDLTLATFQAPHNLSISSADALDTKSGDADPLTITIPATYSFVLLTLTDQTGSGGLWLDSNDDAYANVASGSATVVAYINPDPTGSWTIVLSNQFDSPSVAIENFNAANQASQQTGTGGETPEVATFILIGSGLLAMRYMRRAQKHFFRTPQPAC